MAENISQAQAATIDPGLDKLLNERFGGRVVRKDLTVFRHLHPTLAKDGTWSDYYNPDVEKLVAEGDAEANREKRINMLCELNVRRQVMNICHTTIVQNCWKAGRSLAGAMLTIPPTRGSSTFALSG